MSQSIITSAFTDVCLQKTIVFESESVQVRFGPKTCAVANDTFPGACVDLFDCSCIKRLVIVDHIRVNLRWCYHSAVNISQHSLPWSHTEWLLFNALALRGAMRFAIQKHWRLQWRTFLLFHIRRFNAIFVGVSAAIRISTSLCVRWMMAMQSLQSFVPFTEFILLSLAIKNRCSFVHLCRRSILSRACRLCVELICVLIVFTLNTDFGAPYSIVHRRIALLISPARFDSTGVSMQCSLHLSIIDTMYRLPDWLIGNGPITPTIICSNGFVAVNVFICVAFSFCVCLCCLESRSVPHTSAYVRARGFIYDISASTESSRFASDYMWDE